MDKIVQLFEITTIHHGLMLVGPSGSGKSKAWRVLLEALQRMEESKAEYATATATLQCRAAIPPHWP